MDNHEKFWTAFVAFTAIVVVAVLAMSYSGYSKDAAAAFWHGIGGGIWLTALFGQLKTIKGWLKKG